MLVVLLAVPFITVVVMFVALLSFCLVAIAITRTSACLNDVAVVVRAFSTVVSAMRFQRRGK